MGNKVYDLIKVERKKRGLPNIYWSRDMAWLAQSQAEYCAKVGRLVHSKLTPEGGETLGENLWGGKGNPNPIGAVRGWLNSKAGHKENLLSSEIKIAGIGVAWRNGFTCVAFVFSDASPSYPDCPFYKRRSSPSRRRRSAVKNWIRRHKFWTVIVAVILISFPLSVAGIVNAGGVGQLCGFAIGIYGFWWLSQRGKRKNKSE